MAFSDMIQNIRLRNIMMPLVNGGQTEGTRDPFGVAEGASEAPPQVMEKPQYPDEVSAEMARLYTPDNSANDRFNDVISQYPNRDDYKPNLWNRIAASLISYEHGPRAGMDYFNQPYQDAMLDWKNKASVAQQAANLERYNNANERQMAFQTATTRLNERKLAEKTKNDEANTEIRRQRANVYEFKSRHPDHKIITPGDGHVYAINPDTNEKVDLGIDVLSQQDKYEIQQRNALERIGAQGAESRKTEETRQENRLELEENRQTGRMDLQGKKNEGKVGFQNKPMLPTQERVKNYNKAMEIRNRDANLGKYVKLGPGATDFEVVQPGSGGFFSDAPTQQQYDEIVNRIYGNQVDMRGIGGQPTNAPKAPAGWKYVPKPGGGWTAVEDRGGR